MCLSFAVGSLGSNIQRDTALDENSLYNFGELKSWGLLFSFIQPAVQCIRDGIAWECGQESLGRIEETILGGISNRYCNGNAPADWIYGCKYGAAIALDGRVWGR